MKRSMLAIALVALVLAGASPASGQGVAIGAGQFAIADWTICTSKTHGLWFIAEVDRSVGEYGVSNTASVSEGRCTRQFFKHGWMMFCEASGRQHQLAANEFQMDPALASADLSFTQGRYHQQVHWVGIGNAPDPQADVYAGGFSGFDLGE